MAVRREGVVVLPTTGTMRFEVYVHRVLAPVPGRSAGPLEKALASGVARVGSGTDMP
jgi:hypothetical protein